VVDEVMSQWMRRLWLKLIVKPSDDLPNQGKNQMTFPIKKRINTELFIDGKQGLYIQNR